MARLDPSRAGARSDLCQRIAQLRKHWLEEWASKLTSNDAPINPYRVINELNRLVDKDRTIITHDAGSPRIK